MPTLDPHLTTIFEAIVDAYDAQPAEQRERLEPGPGAVLEASGWW